MLNWVAVSFIGAQTDDPWMHLARKVTTLRIIVTESQFTVAHQRSLHFRHDR